MLIIEPPIEPTAPASLIKLEGSPLPDGLTSSLAALGALIFSLEAALGVKVVKLPTDSRGLANTFLD